MTQTPLARLMAEQEISGRELARRLGLSKNTTSEWVTGTGLPTREHAHHAAEILGTTVEELWPGQTLRPSPTAWQDVAVEYVEPLTVDEVFARKATGRGSWVRFSVCGSGRYDPEVWWPSPNPAAAYPAQTLCAICPVVGDCRDWFLADPLPEKSCVVAGLRGTELVAQARARRTARRQAA
jgi:transcriptional regulator with XRE-family HTH domain